MLSRRDFFAASAAFLATRRLGAEAVPPTSVVTVYKDAGCGCCKEWIKHLAKNGFVVAAHDVAQIDDIKRTMLVPEKLWSCHTAVVDRYAIEGHVPAKDIKSLLSQKPSIQGLAAPGMPVGAPGMEQGDRKDHFDVVAFTRDGQTRVYSRY
jgi:hypothetical protein